MTAVLFAVLLSSCGRSDRMEFALSSVKEETGDVTRKSDIIVYICGAVNSPGIVELPEGSRANDAVAAAGGFADDADTASVNLAKVLKDQEQIFVSSVSRGGEENGPADKRISVNEASKEELMTLPGIGEQKAKRIIEYREEHGRFLKLEDLKKVEGIGDALYNRIKEHLRI